MKAAFFDCQFGAAGDMLLACLLDAGLSQDAWLSEVNKIALPKGSFEIKISDVLRCNIASKKIDVLDNSEKIERHLSEVIEIIEKSKIADAAKKVAAQIFNQLAVAEGKAHGVSPDHIHFHEVGALDAIIDITGFAIACDILSIEKYYASPLPLGGGTAETEHGLFPMPGPAVVNLLANATVPTLSSPINYECLTPTGAAILSTVVHTWGNMPTMSKMTSVGYGAGTRDNNKWPNVIRVILGEMASTKSNDSFDNEAICILEANLDDCSPQTISHAASKLFAAGALDVAVIPAVMKKGRSGHILSVVSKQENEIALQELILAETSTLGVRSTQATRLIAKREWKPVDLAKGSVRIKIARDKSGKLINAQPEYEDCVAYADANKLSLKQVMTEALTAWERRHPAGFRIQG